MRILFIFAIAMTLFSNAVFAQDLSVQGFNKRFKLIKNEEGRVIGVRLKTASLTFSLKPYLQQIKNDLIREQASWRKKGDAQKIQEIEASLLEIGIDVNKKGLFGEEENVRDALMNIPNISVEESFAKLDKTGFMTEFESRIQSALLQLDLALLCNLDDSRFFYRRQVIYQVVTWALNEAKKRFSEVPVLNLASMVIVKVHDLLYEQKTFHHNMLLHYFENIPETQLGMTKVEVDRAISSIYEYRIEASGYMESNRAVANWEKYGWNIFYKSVRLGNNRVRQLTNGMGPLVLKQEARLDFAFSLFEENGVKKIYHLFHNAHQFTSKPALAYDYSQPNKVRRNRALLNLAQVGLGFLPIPSWIKGFADDFVKSFYLEQSRVEGALVGYFESQGNLEMIDAVYNQSNNPYLIR